MTEPPTPPDTLPKYLAEGIPKQDDQTLEHIRAFADTLLEYWQQTVDPAELPDSATRSIPNPTQPARSSLNQSPGVTTAVTAPIPVTTSTGPISTGIITKTARSPPNTKANPATILTPVRIQRQSSA